MDLYPPGQNPAKSLYAAWDMLLRDRIEDRHRIEGDARFQEIWSTRSSRQASVPWMRDRWRIYYVGRDEADDPVYGYGRNEAHGYWQPAMYLTSNGAFAVAIRSWGQRHALAESTFLAYGYLYRTYYWYAPDRPSSTGSWADLAEPLGHRHAVAEWVMNLNSGWLKLTPDPRTRYESAGRWRMMPVAPPGGQLMEAKVQSMERQDAIWYRRKRRIEAAYRRENRLPKLRPLSAPPARLRSGNQTLTSDDSVAQLAALIRVDQPAKPSLQTRPSEAQEENAR